MKTATAAFAFAALGIQQQQNTAAAAFSQQVSLLNIKQDV